MSTNPRPRLSALEGFGRPAPPSARGRSLIALLGHLDRSQWRTPGEIEAAQFDRLGRLLAHARASVPFYRDRDAAGPIADPRRLTREEWRKLPIIRRQDIQAAGATLHSRAVPKRHGPIGEVHTSGTTGRPIRVLRTRLNALYWSAFAVRDHLWHRRDVGGKLAVVRHAGAGEDPYPEGIRQQRWGPTNHVFETGPAVALNINCTAEEQAEWLARQDPDYFLSHPTNVHRVALHCAERGVRLPRLRQVMTRSEVLRPDVRDACRAAWGVAVADVYTTRDVGYLGIQCPETEDYHVQAEGVYLEVLDDDGEPCPPGAVGRVVVTGLHHYAMPLIRYEIGDCAEVGGPCQCGRGLPVIRRIVGREQDMVALPSGERRWTLLSTGSIEAFLAIAPVRQYQFVQKDLDTIEARLVTDRPMTGDEMDSARAWLIERLGHPFRIEFTFVDDIPRTAAGKYRDFISEIDPASGSGR